MGDIDLRKLRDPFEPSEIEWRVGATNKDKLKGIALPYITNRAVQNRLDEVCGAGNWWNDFKQWGENSQLCGITILIDGRPITKWDGADNTNVDPTKGGLSNSMKRAAAQWGIGRYCRAFQNVLPVEIPDDLDGNATSCVGDRDLQVFRGAFCP